MSIDVKHIVKMDAAEYEARQLAFHDLVIAVYGLLKTIKEWPVIHEGGDYLHGGALIEINAALDKVKPFLEAK